MAHLAPADTSLSARERARLPGFEAHVCLGVSAVGNLHLVDIQETVLISEAYFCHSEQKFLT